MVFFGHEKVSNNIRRRDTFGPWNGLKLAGLFAVA
jgi:hypothetical protein